MTNAFMRVRRLVLSAALAGMAGCSSVNRAGPAPAAPVAPAAPPAAAKLAVTTQPSQSSVKTVHPLDDPKSGLVTRSVFFKYDSSQLPVSDRPLLEAHAKYLRASPSAMIRIEGNCDERGTRRYNLELGQKRAEAVHRALLLLGVPEGKMEVVSFGKDRPVDLRHHETAWATNRRVDLNYVRR